MCQSSLLLLTPRPMHVMKNIQARLLIAAVVILQLVWIAIPRIGSYPVSPRVRQAIMTHLSCPKSERDAAVSAAMDQDATVRCRWDIVIFALVVGFDIALIYFFWNYGTRKSTVAPKVSPAKSQ